MRSFRVIIFLLSFVILAFVFLGGRCFYLQYFRKEHYADISMRQQQKRIIKMAQRGAILDCRGRVLAASEKKKIVFAEPRVIKNIKDVSSQLQPILDMGAHEICRMINESDNRGYVKIKEDADEAECAEAQKIYGIGVESSWKRNYPMGKLLSHVVGFVSSDDRGLDGVELQSEDTLKGKAGRNIYYSDARRRSVKLKQSILPQNGSGLILTIDSAIQQFVREELLKRYEEYEAESAVAIVVEPSSGAIMAMVSLPDYDPSSIRPKDIENNIRNRALTDQFEPGSIFKPIVTAIALDSGVIKTDDKIFCEDGNYHGKGFGRIGEYNDRQYGNLSIKEILVKSSNIGVAKIGQKLGKERLYKGLRYFGFGQKTGVDLPGETSGLLWPVDKWTGYSVTRIPFGHEVTVTAMQIVRAFCILANGGHSVRPFVVKATVDNDGNIKKIQRPAAAVGFVIDPDVAKWIVQEALVGVVNEGTGRRARLDKWQVFGKTGTANIALSDRKGYSDQDYIASFVAGAPAEDPKIVVLVSIRKPKRSLGKGYTGGAVASPVAAKIIEKTLDYLEKTSP